MNKMQDDLLVAIHAERIKASKALITGNEYEFIRATEALCSLQLLAAEMGIEITRKHLEQDIFTPMMDNDEMWYIDPITGNGTVYYDLPLMDC